MLELENNFKKNGGEFQEFRIEEVFTKCNLAYKATKKFNKLTDLRKEWSSEFSLPLVNAKSGNNGIMYYGRMADWEAEELTIDVVADGAVSTGNAYPQPQLTGVLYNAYLIKPTKPIVSSRQLCFLSTCVEKSIKKRFSYENKATWPKVKKISILLPVSRESRIDYQYMEDYIRELEEGYIRELDRYLKVAGLDNEEINSHEISLIQQLEKGSLDKKSKLFEVKNLFSILKIKHMLKKSATSEVGMYPVFSSDTSNNGIIGYTEDPEFLVDQENPIYVIFGDHTRRLNFTDVNFSVADNVKVLKPTHAALLDSDCLLFIFTLWKKQIKNLGYARHWKIAKDCLIDLPVTPEGEIDVKTIRATVNAIKKLVIADVVKFKNEYIEKSKQAIK